MRAFSRENIWLFCGALEQFMERALVEGDDLGMAIIYFKPLPSHRRTKIEDRLPFDVVRVPYPKDPSHDLMIGICVCDAHTPRVDGDEIIEDLRVAIAGSIPEEEKTTEVIIKYTPKGESIPRYMVFWVNQDGLVGLNETETQDFLEPLLAPQVPATFASSEDWLRKIYRSEGTLLDPEECTKIRQEWGKFRKHLEEVQDFYASFFGKGTGS